VRTPPVAVLLAILPLARGAVAQEPDRGGRPPQTAPMLLPQAVVLPAAGEVVVDGALTEWPNLPALVLGDRRQLSGTAPGAWNGERDCSALAFLMWNGDVLCLALQVRDEWHRPLDRADMQLSEIPLADSVVLTFDPGRDTRSNGPDPGRREDREFWLADESGRAVVQWDRLRGGARLLDAEQARCVVVHDKEQGITTYEATLPWPEILPPGWRAEVGRVIDFQLVVNDFDEATDPMPQTRIGWTFGCGPLIDPGLFGSLMLVGDGAALQGQLPEFPPKPAVGTAPLGTAAQWRELTARLLQAPPAIHDGAAPPELAGGLRRLEVLELLDGRCEAYPRVDHVEFAQRIARRMSREVAGIRGRGLPYWWSTRLESLSKAAEDPVPAGRVRIFRLPMGGWLVATPAGGFAIDPAGAGLGEWLWGRLGFAVLTQPLDAMRRNDHLLLGMLEAEPPRPVLTHIAFHLPNIEMRDMKLVLPGSELRSPDGTKLTALGRVALDGAVARSCSYHIEVEGGPRLLVVAPALAVDEVGDEPVDVMVLSPHNPRLLQIVAKVRPGLILIDDAFCCQTLPGLPRLQLRDLHSLQKALQPWRSLLLAPGESWDVTRAE
jgi:hypothetical protein